jgi:hypothetical protein
MHPLTCPSCHVPIAATEVVWCDVAGGEHFWQCPECLACFPAAVPANPPLPDARREVLPDLVAA